MYRLVTNIRRLGSVEFEESYPERGLTSDISIATLDLEPNEGFSIICSGRHYVNEKGARQSCTWQNMVRLVAQRHGRKVRTAHKGNELQVYRDK